MGATGTLTLPSDRPDKEGVIDTSSKEGRSKSDGFEAKLGFELSHDIPDQWDWSNN
jgi:hypothetical protein